MASGDRRNHDGRGVPIYPVVSGDGQQSGEHACAALDQIGIVAQEAHGAPRGNLEAVILKVEVQAEQVEIAVGGVADGRIRAAPGVWTGRESSTR